MNTDHLRAFVWLRWALLRNMLRRAGTLSNVLMMIVIVSLIVAAIPSFFGCLALGIYLIPRATPAQLMYAWDAILVAFLFFWAVGLLTELQRSDSLSLDKFLHLPVSVREAFLINYVSSWAKLNLILFVPIMLGYAAALVWVKGAGQLVTLGLVAAFLLMVTAVTYQIQGWLAALMSNPRRRRTVIVMFTGGFVLLAQAPNLLNMLAPWGPGRQADRWKKVTELTEEAQRRFRAGEIDANEQMRLINQAQTDGQAEHHRRNQETVAAWKRGARLANVVLPVGWLPMGTMDAAEGSVLSPLAGLLGMTLIGAGSLAMAYRTTLRTYRGDASAKATAPARPAASPGKAGKRPGNLVEARVPGLSEPVAAVALGGLRSLLRAPEAKMMLLTPLIMVPILGTMLFRTGIGAVPDAVRPLLAMGAMSFTLFGFIQVMGNQFGFDRDGFRVYVLGSASRRDILLGKNLAFAPLILPLMALLSVAVQFFAPMRLDHLAALVPEAVAMFVMFCTIANLMSIVAPLYIAAGAMKASNPKFSTIMIQLLTFMVLFPLTQGLLFLPLGAEALARHLGWIDRAPVFLLGAVVACGLAVGFYALSLGWLGSLLKRRETWILETVTNRG